MVPMLPHVHTIAERTRAPSCIQHAGVLCFGAGAPAAPSCVHCVQAVVWDAVRCLNYVRGQPDLLGWAHAHAGRKAPTQAPATPRARLLLGGCGYRRCTLHQRVPWDRLEPPRVSWAARVVALHRQLKGRYRLFAMCFFTHGA